MKLTKDNIKLNVTYKVTEGIKSKIKVNDSVTIEFEKGHHFTCNNRVIDEFTIFRWARKEENKNEVWRFDIIEEVISFLSDFEFEFDIEKANEKIRKLKLKIDRIIHNYELPLEHTDIWDSVNKKHFKNDWNLNSFIDENGKMKDVQIERFESKDG